MADGRWPMGGWPMAGAVAGDGGRRWPVADGRWPMAGGRWQWPWPVADGRWPMAGGRWAVAVGLCLFH